VFFDYSLDVASSFDANGQAIYSLAPLGTPVLRGSLSSSLFFSSLLRIVNSSYYDFVIVGNDVARLTLVDRLIEDLTNM